MLSGVIFCQFWSHFGHLRAPKSNFFVICWGFVFSLENHEFWNRLAIERDPEAGQNEVPDSTISKDLPFQFRVEESKQVGRRLYVEGYYWKNRSKWGKRLKAKG